jgi:predicted nucleic acid-binding protein
VIVLDASVLIAHLESTDVHHQRATQLLLSAAADQLAISPITMAEVLVGPARAHQMERVVGIMRELEVTTVPLTEDSPVRLANLRATTRLRLPDCCVLLAAEAAGATIATFDNRLAEAASDLRMDVRTS